MAQATTIEWLQGLDGRGYSWNPLTGCTKVSPGCAHCYAEAMAHRLTGRHGYPSDQPFLLTLRHDRLDEPLRWRKPRRVFLSMSDLFHEHAPVWFIDAVLDRIGSARRHTFFVLTKRAARMARIMRDYYQLLADRPAPPRPFRNLWLGVSAEDHKRALERIPFLVQTPAVIRWVSLEPLLGLPNLSEWLALSGQMEIYGPDGKLHWRRPVDHPDVEQARRTPGYLVRPGGIDWIVAGGESGPRARPTHPDWVRRIRDQAKQAGVPFFFKGWGAWQPIVCSDEEPAPGIKERLGEPWSKQPRVHIWSTGMAEGCGRGLVSVRMGKRNAGRLLDGRTWDEVPDFTIEGSAP